MNLYCKRSILSAITILYISVNIYGQLADPSIRNRLNQAKDLYNKELYTAAKQMLNKASELVTDDTDLYRSEIEAMEIMCAIALQKPDIDGMVNNFILKYPDSKEINTIYFKQASFHFNLKNYDKAAAIFQQIDEQHLFRQYKPEFYFEYGYTFFSFNDRERALKYFDKVIKTSPYTTFTNPAKYYTAYILYQQKEFNKAIPIFKQIENDHRFKILAKYYILESKFMIKELPFVIEEGTKLYDIVDGEFRTKIARMLSEAYYAQGNASEAQKYFEKFSKENKEQLSKKDTYYSALLSYNQKEYQNAIVSFSQIITENDSLSQSAAYYLGQCYIETKNKQKALESFKIASTQPFDKSVKEDALFNYAKLSFDLNSDISIFKRYLAEYTPEEGKYNAVYNYIADGYLIKQEYKSAVEALKMVRQPKANDCVRLQKASLLAGLKLIEMGAFRESVPYLELSLKNGDYNDNVYNLTLFWLAESLYRDDKFDKAIEINRTLINMSPMFKKSSEYSTAFFNLAYCYFKKMDFTSAEEWFRKYLLLNNISYLADEANVRLGESLMMLRKYDDANYYFSKVSGTNSHLHTYANYQKAISIGLSGNNEEKISILESLVEKGNNKELSNEIIYELGRTLIQTGKNEQAIRHLKQLTTISKKSPYHTKALLELGLVYKNSNRIDEAIASYKSVITINSNTQDAQSALIGLESLYQESGKTAEFMDYLDNSGLSHSRTTEERERLSFNSAEQIFLAGDYNSAITQLSKYLQRYPNGSKSVQAMFYIGDALQKSGKPESALDYYKRVMDREESSFREIATLNYAKISFDIEKYKQALEGYSSLGHIAVLENNKREATKGRILSFFMDKQYQNTVEEINKVDISKFSNNEQREIRFALAKSYYLLGQRDNATPILKSLSKDKKSAIGAESSYLIIANAFDNGNFENVEKETILFAESGTKESYWLAKSFILLGDSYIERNNLKQAEATYRSILDSYTPISKDDIAEQINMRLKKISQKQQ